MFDQVYQAAEKVYQQIKLGAQLEAVEDRFVAFAGGVEQADEYLIAFNAGAQNTVDRMTAMEKSAKLLQMGLATNTDEMQLMSEMATKLGNQTISAGARVDDFSLLLANQAVRRLDNFGMSSGRVRDRIDELIESGQALNREQAFKMAVMEEGAVALAKLGDTSQTAAVRLGQTEANVSNMKAGVSELALAYAESTPAIYNWQVTIKSAADIMDWMTGLLRKNQEVVVETSQAITGYNGYIGDGISTMDQYSQAIDSVSYVSDGMMVANRMTMSSQAQLETVILDTIEAIEEEARAADELSERLGDFALNATMQWTSYYQGVDQQAEDFETRREQLATKHQETLDELAKRGQSQAIQINEAAEKQKLADLVWSLEQAELQLSEYGDKTRESTLRAKQKQIEDLRVQVGTQQTLLDDYHAGRLRTTGENVDALIGEEDRRHQAAIVGLQEEIEATKELQKQQLGSLMLDTFETWAEIEDIPAEAMLEMRTAIAKEYGLISEEEAQLVGLSIQSWTGWKDKMYENTEATISQLAKTVESVHILKRALDSLPGGGVGEIVPDNMRGFYSGTGESNSTTNYNFNQTVNTQASSHNVVSDWETARNLVP